MPNAFERQETSQIKKEVTSEDIAAEIIRVSSQLAQIRTHYARPKWVQTFSLPTLEGNIFRITTIHAADVLGQEMGQYKLQSVEAETDPTVLLSFLEFAYANPTFIQLLNEANCVFCAQLVMNHSTQWKAIPTIYPAQLELIQGKLLMDIPLLHRKVPIQRRARFSNQAEMVAALGSQPLLLLPAQVMAYVNKYREQLAQQQTIGDAENKKRYLAGRATHDSERKRKSPILEFTRIFSLLEAELFAHPEAVVEFKVIRLTMIAYEDIYMLEIKGLPDTVIHRLKSLPPHDEIKIDTTSVETDAGYQRFPTHTYQIEPKTYKQFKDLMLDYVTRFTQLRPTRDLMIDTAKNLEWFTHDKRANCSLEYRAVPQHKKWRYSYDSSVKMIFTVQTRN